MARDIDLLLRSGDVSLAAPRRLVARRTTAILRSSTRARRPATGHDADAAQ